MLFFYRYRNRGKKKKKKGKKFVQVHTAECRSQDFDPGSLAPEAILDTPRTTSPILQIDFYSSCS